MEAQVMLLGLGISMAVRGIAKEKGATEEQLRELTEILTEGVFKFQKDLESAQDKRKAESEE